MKRSPLKRAKNQLSRSAIVRKAPAKLKRMRPEKARARAAFRKAVLKKFDGRCMRCFVPRIVDGSVLALGMTVKATDPHHHLPLGRGGKDDPSNGIPLCRQCHDWIGANPAQAYLDGWVLKFGEQPNENARKIRAWMAGKNS